MPSGPATVVLVHGAWHGAWCWEQVLPLLEDAGVPALAVDLPDAAGIPGDLGADVAAVRRILDGLGGPAVLCGHSYGGMVVTDVGLHPAVVHLVYIAALVADTGTSVRRLGEHDPGKLWLPAVRGDDGLVRLEAAAVELMYHDVDPAEVVVVRDRLRPQRPEGFRRALSAAAWHSVPSTYAICLEDRAISPGFQRWMATQVGSETVEWPTGHSPFYVRPELVAGLLTDVVRRGSRV